MITKEGAQLCTKLPVEALVRPLTERAKKECKSKAGELRRQMRSQLCDFHQSFDDRVLTGAPRGNLSRRELATFWPLTTSATFTPSAHLRERFMHPPIVAFVMSIIFEVAIQASSTREHWNRSRIIVTNAALPGDGHVFAAHVALRAWTAREAQNIVVSMRVSTPVL